MMSMDTLAGAIGFAGALITFVIATKLTTAANAIFLQLTAPVYVALFSGWILGEKVKPLDWIITGIIMSGMVLFFGDKLTIQGFWGNKVLCYGVMERVKENFGDGSPSPT